MSFTLRFSGHETFALRYGWLNKSYNSLDYKEKLSDLGFMRVHRSFIVRLDKIESIDYPNLSLEDNKKIIPIGGSYRDEFNNRIRQV